VRFVSLIFSIFHPLSSSSATARNLPEWSAYGQEVVIGCGSADKRGEAGRSGSLGEKVIIIVYNFY
jgi:hypothetical protein